MLNTVPKSVNFGDYLNFVAVYDIFLWSMCQNLYNLTLVILIYLLTLNDSRGQIRYTFFFLFTML